jgi:hypothetical protein
VDSIETDGPALDDQGLNSIVLNTLADQLKELGAEAFARLYPCAFLVLQHGPPRGDDWIDLNTSEASMPRPKDLDRRLTDIRTIPLIKSDRNAFGSKVTVGRARNNDVIIRAPKISKLHSTFLLEGKSGYRLQDMGSLNGTVVNGNRLKKKERADLRSGDLISFWRYVFEFLSFDELVRRIQGH